MDIEDGFTMLAKTEAYLILLHLTLCPTDVAFFSPSPQLKARPSIRRKITSRFIAFPSALPPHLPPLFIEMTLHEYLSSF